MCREIDLPMAEAAKATIEATLKCILLVIVAQGITGYQQTRKLNR
jgi:hypothetical protein